ncbi:DNA repair protein RAD51 homolog 2 [Cornus florida]|uniref:DNA repair protein RAD51 homolog 2 n=1 Tax=Cornus florida TaxID=4283 RepID=UPI0028A1A645|nr:DNA repair protein RAD51 homolog 2 [Cornus florida]XP_059626715.1 DNA repair protein RAD51 homolog 2 [Cornus florida]XP_059626716.1 DNA repair protein RAD51 homolog 2 [Cornus florida]XP_059626717.1 DNA repair protein RAD51 homolog 2 [Cornus florida]XP_059626718.1 DNA repair protein RAD51 homolog 2 [Cornus florida]XP_059626719.1 DNA repair protein RAD51 homolog 2 [Cornus florida]XP_059626720.1 DNA repair protein RAD51 homolog 2 [Cornus florida]XP_059626721.1 DNA repair protein RAD51 homolo
MANKLITQMGLPKSIANILAARNITTAKDALSLTEFELMELLDVGLAEVTSAVAYISEIACPPFQTAISLLEQHLENEFFAGHLPTRLKGLDGALCGGIPFGVLTEVVGPAGIGKTQFCLKLSLLASLPANCGGLDGHVIYIDVESKFSSRRMIEIGVNSFPEIFHTEGMAQEMAGRILVLRPSSLSEFTESLQQIKVSLLQHKVKLLVIDSMAALISGEYEQGPPRQHALGWHISFIKSLAEFSRIPILVTNQVRSQSSDEASQYSFQVPSWDDTVNDPARFDSHLGAALGIHWAHAVAIRLVLESKSGQRFMKIAKSPISPSLSFPFKITSSGILLLSDDGIEMTGPQMNTIHCQGHNNIINFDNEKFR